MALSTGIDTARTQHNRRANRAALYHALSRVLGRCLVRFPPLRLFFQLPPNQGTRLAVCAGERPTKTASFSPVGSIQPNAKAHLNSSLFMCLTLYGSVEATSVDGMAS